ncbi:aminopeptidase Y [Sodiomyces alkalinus F11]|uniref:Peptide hydrolase n=1 Tax=Sodiomyces alkalinus (strain CBS 110278 / VKM F-3762 / F11) TaxID=1314773 RepID=A0A3N2Q5Y2_SODAK|nr:aminopeptidase Y [Sodiomyces alkalinus F11]ROT42193.1 aminopeptidase Y [Sodiomyces alkalinus F11]
MKTTSSLAAGLWALGAFARNPLTPEKAVEDIKTQELQRNLWNFNKIARDNGGNRAFGLPGYEASSDYVLERAQTRFHTTMDTWKQYFNHTFTRINDISVTGPEGEDVVVIALTYNPATPAEGITAPLIDTPVDDARGSACFEDQWEGIDATGRLALVKRGACAISDKLKLASAHGALGVILYNNSPGNAITAATLGRENIGLLPPVGTIPLEVGTAWSARLRGGEELVVKLYVDAVFEDRETWNIISETKEGDPDNVIVLGAHLDSVQAGPGVNDDGSGSGALLEIMGSFKKYTGFKNKVRFIWWGAEESGLIGSLYYTSTLPEEEADKIRFYFNYDMIGSISPKFDVYQGRNPGDAYGAALLQEYLLEEGYPAQLAPFGTGSDYVGFINIGVPSSGLHTGTPPFDPCYHLACDGIDNINWDAYTANVKAAARAAAIFANDLSGVPPRSRTTPAKRDFASVRREFERWAAIAEEAEHGHSCGGEHGSKNTI